jgi:hypothetical protein
MGTLPVPFGSTAQIARSRAIATTLRPPGVRADAIQGSCERERLARILLHAIHAGGLR